MDPVVGNGRQPVTGFIAGTGLLPGLEDLTGVQFERRQSDDEVSLHRLDVIGPNAHERCDNECSIDSNNGDSGRFLFDPPDPAEVLADTLSLREDLPLDLSHREIFHDVLTSGLRSGFYGVPANLEAVLGACAVLLADPKLVKDLACKPGLDYKIIEQFHVRISEHCREIREQQERRDAEIKFSALAEALGGHMIYGQNSAESREHTGAVLAAWRGLGVTRGTQHFEKFREQAEVVLSVCREIPWNAPYQDATKQFIRSFIDEVVFEQPFELVRDNLLSFGSRMRERVQNSPSERTFRSNVDIWLKHVGTFGADDVACLMDLAASKRFVRADPASGNGRLLDGKRESPAMREGPLVDYISLVSLNMKSRDAVEALWLKISGFKPDTDCTAPAWLLRDRTPGMKITTVIEAAFAKLGINAEVRIDGRDKTWQLHYALPDKKLVL